MSDEQLAAAKALRSIAHNEEIKQLVLETEELYKPLRRVADRYIGGESLNECLQTAEKISSEEHAVTFDYIGEGPRDESRADAAVGEVQRLVNSIGNSEVEGSLSVDLSQIGLTNSRQKALENARKVVTAADDHGVETLINMEGPEYTDDILAVYTKLAEEIDSVGITLQAYLYRTDEDITEVLDHSGRVRLVKGAYEAPANAVRSESDSIDTAYRQYMKQLLDEGHPCELATHDESILDAAHNHVQNHGLEGNDIKISMLYGVTPGRLDTMRDLGYDTRVYLPYGDEWYLYLLHRIAEHPPNIYKALADAAGTETEKATTSITGNPS
jgi:proline dehydrogenase